MANARLVRQNFFNEPKLSKYKIEERYLLIGLACTADDFGRLWYDVSNIKSIIFSTYKDITEKWIQDVITKLIKNGVFCEYEVDDISYLHFPLWFKTGWYLKQRIDHPKEFGGCPDCPFCKTEDITRKKRETSRAIKSNLTEVNVTQENTSKGNLTREDVVKQLTTRSYMEERIEDYPLVSGMYYTNAIDRYLSHVEKNGSWDTDHRRNFETYIMSEQEQLENKESEL